MAGSSASTAARLAPLAATCNAIGGELADAAGFVSIRALLSRFQSELIRRPLLVEAMVAHLEHQAPEGKANGRWAVLVDSDRYSVTDQAILDESHERPLPARFRFTIAHELAHSLAFRPREFGIAPLFDADTKASREEFVEAVERETDRMAPLLLLPDKTLRTLLATQKVQWTAPALQTVCRRFGISRYALINRLLLLLRRDEASGLREATALRNLAIGIGNWTAQGEAVLRKWPLYINFDNGIVPGPLLRVANQDRVPAASLIQDSQFILCGGRLGATELTWEAGLPGSKPDQHMRVQISVEPIAKRPNSDFLVTFSAQR
jgi:hypothetical protein